MATEFRVDVDMIAPHVAGETLTAPMVAGEASTAPLVTGEASTAPPVAGRRLWLAKRRRRSDGLNSRPSRLDTARNGKLITTKQLIIQINR